MTNPTQRSQEEQLLLSKVADDYRREGYKVFIAPQPDDLPFDLGMYSPDLLVKKSEDRGYLIEVRSSADRISVERFREIAETVAEHPGWRFLLITDQDSPKGKQVLSWAEIEKRKEQGEQLIAQGKVEAAFLSLWAVAEALMRKQAEQALIPIEQFPPVSLIKHLYTQGELSIEQYDKAMSLIEVRNRLVHGFQTANLEPATIELQKLVDDLLDATMQLT